MAASDPYHHGERTAMIANITTGSSFSGLAAYLTAQPERVAWTEPRWLLGTDPAEIAREMEAAASQSSRVEKPVYHVSLSFAAGDQVSRETMTQAAERVLEELGLGEHQALLVAHCDTKHPHVHVMVNRVHPETGRAWQTGRDYARIETILRRLEKEWGLTRTPGHHAREPGVPAPDRTRSHETGEIRRSRRTGEPPFAEVVRNRVGADLSRARSWRELARLLERSGLRAEPRGRGMVITDGQHYAKASSVHREASLPRLERRFGQTLASYLAETRAPVPHRGTPHREAHSGRRPGRGASLLGLAGRLRSVQRLKEEPEKETPKRAARHALRAAAALVKSDPVLRDVVRDIRAYEQVHAKEAAMQRALQAYREAERAVARIPSLERRTAELSMAFDRELARVYRDPASARDAFEKAVARDGHTVAVEHMRHAPEHFGELRQARQRTWLGMRSATTGAPVRRAARSAADVGAQYLRARAELPLPGDRARWRATLEAKGIEATSLQQSLKNHAPSHRLVERIGERARALSPDRLETLGRVLSPQHVQIVTRAMAKALDVARGRSR